MNFDFQNFIFYVGVAFALITVSVHFYDISVIVPVFLKRWISDRQSAREVANELMIVTNEYITFSAHLEHKIKDTKNDFLKTTMQTFISGSLRGPDLIRALRERANTIYDKEISQVANVHQMGKSFPVLVWCVAIFGVFGLININGISNLGAYSKIIIYAALGLSLYGVAFSYFILNPTIEHLHKCAGENKQINQMIIFGVTLMQRHCDAFEAFEAINLYLVEGSPIQWEDVFIEKRPLKNTA